MLRLLQLLPFLLLLVVLLVQGVGVEHLLVCQVLQYLLLLDVRCQLWVLQQLRMGREAVLGHGQETLLQLLLLLLLQRGRAHLQGGQLGPLLRLLRLLWLGLRLLLLLCLLLLGRLR